MTESSESTVLAGLNDEALERRREHSGLEEEVLVLFDRLHDRLLTYALKFPLTLQVCQEVVQDAFLALFQHLQRGRSRENLNGWLFRVVHNIGIKRLQASRRGSRDVVALSSSVEEAVADSGLNPEDRLAQSRWSAHWRESHVRLSDEREALEPRGQSMKDQQAHLSDRELIMAMDGELCARDARGVGTHMQACWTCRARKTELDRAISDFVHMRRLELQLPPVDGPRAMLKARLADVAQSPRAPWWFPIARRSIGWTAAAIACALLTVWMVADRFMAEQRPSVVLAAPNPALTPGAAVLETSRELCREWKPKNKEVNSALRRRVFEEYGLTNAPAQAYEVDYLITPALGGADDIRNLWPHSYRNTEWNAKVKDELEDRLRDLVCQGTLDLPTAQREIASNWIGAYKKYFHAEHPIRSRE